MKQIAFSLLSVVILVAMVLPGGSPAVLTGDSPSAMVLAGDVSNLTLYPTDDSWVNQKDPDATHGNENKLHAKYRNGRDETRRSYLKFDLSDVPDTGCIWSGKLWLHKAGGDIDVVVGAYNVSKYYNATATNWTEGGINWTNAPTDFSLVDSIHVGAAGDDWYVWDVTSAAQNATGDVLSLALRVVDESGDSKHEDFYSKEEPGYEPYLELTYCYYVTANFTATPTSGCAPLTVQFTDLSTGDPTSWSWDFGDGSNSSVQNPSHQYGSGGSYNVSLTVSNACGSDTMTRTGYITVTEAPVAAFSATPTSGCAPLNVTFSDESTGGPTSWSWDFGDGNASSVQNPSHQYSSGGSYNVSLTVSNACGSDDEIKVGYINVSEVTYNLTVTSAGCCPIDVSGAVSGTVSAGGSETFTGIGEGENVTVSADDSAVCCAFVNWSDAGEKTHNITMDSDKSVTAYCSVPSYNLTVNVSPGGGGNVTVNGTTPSSYPDTTTWNCGEGVTVNAVAASGYIFVNWSGDLSGNVTPTNITMASDKSVTANFEEQPKICVSPPSLTLTVAPNTTGTTTYTITNCGGGTLSWNSSNVTYDPDGNMPWLTQNPINGTLTANVSDTVLVTADATGLPEGNYTATITITGSTFILPIILDVTEPTDIDVMRNLPGTALMPNQTYPGDTFDVYVNFTAVVSDFNAIGLTDVAPDGWTVQVDKTWCTPAPYSVEARGNKVEILWSGPFSSGTNFSALYKVTVPLTATPGINLFPDCNISEAWLEYYFGEEGPYTSCVWGDYEMMITVPSDIVGETRDVNANPLADVEVLLYKEAEGYLRTDISTPNYSNTAYRTGQYWLCATRVRYYEVNITDMTMLSPYYINFTTPEILAAGYVFDFEGNYGLVPRACNMSYALKSVNLWLSPPSEHPEWGIDEWKAMDSIHSWQYPS